MRKNKMMRFASGLLVAALLTTSIISGTFAKYVTTTSGSDKARVAYWGFNQAASTTIDLFDDTYTNVDSANDDNVIAPGTTKTAEFGFKYTPNTNKSINAPEVGYKLTINATATGSYADLDANDSFKWTLKSGKDGADVKEYKTVAELLSAIKDLSGSTDGSGSKDYNAGELPDAFGTAAKNANCEVGWKWEYNGQDSKDTEMGNAETLNDVNITISVTATQND